MTLGETLSSSVWLPILRRDMFIDSAKIPKRRITFISNLGSLMDMDENSQVQWLPQYVE